MIDSLSRGLDAEGPLIILVAALVAFALVVVRLVRSRRR
jgi:hypothetical protein